MLFFQLVSRLPIYVHLSIDIEICVFDYNWYQNDLFSFNWYHKLVSWCFDVYLRTWLLYLSISIIMFWFVLLICKESLTSSLYIDSCWVYVILKWLTFLWYVVHVCSRMIGSQKCIFIIIFSYLFFYKALLCNILLFSVVQVLSN